MLCTVAIYCLILNFQLMILLALDLFCKFQMSMSQISYSLVVILELNNVSEVQYKEVMIIGNE